MTAQIYVGTYAKYNNGSIAGAWLSLDEHDTAETFDAAARKLHKREHDPELMFQDYEGFPSEFYGESYLDERLWEWLALSKTDQEIVEAWLDENGGSDSIEYITECYMGHASSWREYVEEYIESTGMLSDIPDQIAQYFDYEAYGNDLAHDYTVVETTGGVHVFRNC